MSSTRASAGGLRRDTAPHPASPATSATKSRVAPTPIGTVLVKGWPSSRSIQRAAASPVSGYISTLKCAAPMRAMSDGVRAHRRDDVDARCPGPRAAPVTSVMSSRWRKPERGGADQVGGDLRGAVHRAREGLHDLEEGLVRAEIFLALIATAVPAGSPAPAGPSFRTCRRDRPGSVRRCRTRRRSSPRA